MIRTISPAELKRKMDGGETVHLIDVRSPREFEAGHIPNAICLPVQSARQWAPKIGLNGPVVLICHSGGRACVAHDILKNHREDVQVLTGGTAGWQYAGFPVVQGE